MGRQQVRTFFVVLPQAELDRDGTGDTQTLSELGEGAVEILHRRHGALLLRPQSGHPKQVEIRVEYDDKLGQEQRPEYVHYRTFRVAGYNRKIAFSVQHGPELIEHRELIGKQVKK